MRKTLLASLLISSCAVPVPAFPEKDKKVFDPPHRAEDKYDLKKAPKTIPKNVPVLNICIDGVKYYFILPSAVTPALTRKGKLIACGKFKS